MSFWNWKTVKSARKAHHCDECGGKIEAGETYKYGAGLFDGEFYSCYDHAECYAAWVALNEAADRAGDEYTSIDDHYQEYGAEIKAILIAFPTVYARFFPAVGAAQ